MLTKLRMRLTIVMLALIGFSVLAAGLFTAKVIKDSYIDSTKENMERELRILIASSDWLQAGTERDLITYYTERVNHLRASADARITFIRADGKVLGDSDYTAIDMENHVDRNEIIEAKETGVGSSIRYSDTLNENMLYVAVAVSDQQLPEGYLRLSLSLAAIEASVDRLWRFLLIGLLALFVIAGLIAFRISHRMTKPIEQITAVAQHISNHHYDVRVQVKSQDEIGRLAAAINKMAGSLKEQVSRISENESRISSVLANMTSGILMVDLQGKLMLVNRSAEQILGYSAEQLLGSRYNEVNAPKELVHLIAASLDNKSAERAEMVLYYPEERILEMNTNPVMQEEGWAGILVVLRDVTGIRRLERMRSEFVANVSHELKTPIAAVKGFAETLLNGAIDDKETSRDFLQIIYDESERLNRLIGDILELSRIEAKRIPMQFSPIHMGDFVAQTMRMLQSEAIQKQIELTMNVEEECYVEADEDRLRQILLNLIANGIAYTPVGGSVSVDVVTVEEERIRITIADTGVGIPKKDLPRIFERFYRVDKARTRGSGGTGLGLSIVKHLVEQHKGSIHIDSETGIGTTIVIELPVLQDYHIISAES